MGALVNSPSSSLVIKTSLSALTQPRQLTQATNTSDHHHLSIVHYGTPPPSRRFPILVFPHEPSCHCSILFGWSNQVCFGHGCLQKFEAPEKNLNWAPKVYKICMTNKLKTHFQVQLSPIH